MKKYRKLLDYPVFFHYWLLRYSKINENTMEQHDEELKMEAEVKAAAAELPRESDAVDSDERPPTPPAASSEASDAAAQLRAWRERSIRLEALLAKKSARLQELEDTVRLSLLAYYRRVFGADDAGGAPAGGEA